MRKAIALSAVCLTCAAASHAPAQRKRPVAVHHYTNKTVAKPKHVTQTWRAGQTQPDPDRLREIQQALVKKGYLSQEATGSWDQQTADALRRFQKDQNLDANGKLDSLSIIALGLGPQYTATRP